MSYNLFVRIPPSQYCLTSDTEVQWRLYDNKTPVHPTQTSTLEALGSAIAEPMTDIGSLDNTVVLLSGRFVLYRQQTVPPKQRKHLQSTLPFLLEEELAEDVSDLHFASAPSHQGEKVSIAVIGQDILERLLDLLKAQGLSPGAVLAEASLLPECDEQPVVWVDDNATLFCRPGHAPLSMEFAALSVALEALADGEDNPSLSLVCSEEAFDKSDERMDALYQAIESSGWLVERTVLHGTVFEHRVAHYFSQSSEARANLRSGLYQCPDSSRKSDKRQKWLAAVAACWLVLQSALMIGEGLYFQHKANTFWQQSAELYLETFPRDRSMLDAVADRPGSVDVRGRLNSRLQATPEAFNPSFLPLLSQLSVASESLQPVQFQPNQVSFNHQTQQLQIVFEADSLDTVDQLLATLKANGLESQLDNASQSDTGVVARLTLGG